MVSSVAVAGCGRRVREFARGLREWREEWRRRYSEGRFSFWVNCSAWEGTRFAGWVEEDLWSWMPSTDQKDDAERRKRARRDADEFSMTRWGE